MGRCCPRAALRSHQQRAQRSSGFRSTAALRVTEAGVQTQRGVTISVCGLAQLQRVKGRHPAWGERQQRRLERASLRCRSSDVRRLIPLLVLHCLPPLTHCHCCCAWPFMAGACRTHAILGRRTHSRLSCQSSSRLRRVRAEAGRRPGRKGTAATVFLGGGGCLAGFHVFEG